MWHTSVIRTTYMYKLDTIWKHRPWLTVWSCTEDLLHRPLTINWHTAKQLATCILQMLQKRDSEGTYTTQKVKDILKVSRCFVRFRELALILVFNSRYWQISLTFLCSVDCLTWTALMGAKIYNSNMNTHTSNWNVSVYLSHVRLQLQTILPVRPLPKLRQPGD